MRFSLSYAESRSGEATALTMHEFHLFGRK